MTTVDVDVLADKERRLLGFERVEVMSTATFKDCSTIIIVPSRDKTFDFRVVRAWEGMIAPMNQNKAKLYCVGDEVGIAYNNMISHILADPTLSKWKYVLTLEADNIIPPDALPRLIESIEAGKFDGVSGLYFTKGDINMPMAYGSPAEYLQTGKLDFRPLDVAEALKAGQVMEVNGIAMGCSLYRLELFRQVAAPWFVTVSDVVQGGGMGFTQDLFFCKRAREMGKRFAVDMRVRVGHLDIASGIEY